MSGLFSNITSAPQGLSGATPIGPFGPGGNIGGGPPQDPNAPVTGTGYKGGDLSFGAPQDTGIPPGYTMGFGVEPPGTSVPVQPGTTMPGMGGKGAPGGSTPGMGGKGPQQGPQQGFDGRPLDQQFPGTLNMPQPPAAPPAAVAQGGTPGRPVPSAPMSPRGPGYANPGASGVARSLQGAQQQMFAPQGILTNPQGQNQPLTGNFQPSGMQTRLQPARPVAPAPINRPLTGNFQPTMPQRRGAGRGGMLR